MKLGRFRQPEHRGGPIMQRLGGHPPSLPQNRLHPVAQITAKGLRPWLHSHTEGVICHSATDLLISQMSLSARPS